MLGQIPQGPKRHDRPGPRYTSHPSAAEFVGTLDEVVKLRPARLAVYSFACLPSMRRNQKRIDGELLPDRATKFPLLTAAASAFDSAGNSRIGMDHFVLPHDELSIARARGTLFRNFMGYTTKRAPDLIASGTSGISDVQGR